MVISSVRECCPESNGFGPAGYSGDVLVVMIISIPAEMIMTTVQGEHPGLVWLLPALPDRYAARNAMRGARTRTPWSLAVGRRESGVWALPALSSRILPLSRRGHRQRILFSGTVSRARTMCTASSKAAFSSSVVRLSTTSWTSLTRCSYRETNGVSTAISGPFLVENNVWLGLKICHPASQRGRRGLGRSRARCSRQCRRYAPGYWMFTKSEGVGRADYPDAGVVFMVSESISCVGGQARVVLGPQFGRCQRPGTGAPACSRARTQPSPPLWS